MRQRILVILALILAFYLSVSLVVRFGKGSDLLTLQDLDRLHYTYSYLKIARTERSREKKPVSLRETMCQFVFKERRARGSREFSSGLSVGNYTVSVDGIPVSNPPWIVKSNTKLDGRGRIIVNGGTDLYALDLLNSPEFFPILSGTVSEPGDEWEDQFRVIPPVGDPIIVVVNTSFKDHVFDDAQLLALLKYEAKGESYFADPLSGEPRKASLRISGSCKWNTSLGLPHSLQQSMEYLVMDYGLIRASGDLLADERLATISSVKTTVSLKLEKKTAEKEESRSSF